MVKLYCPKCQEIYNPKSSRHHHTDGAYFGTGFPVSIRIFIRLRYYFIQHMLFMVHPEYRPKRPTSQFVARLYGFKIHPMAYQLQQVKEILIMLKFFSLNVQIYVTPLFSKPSLHCSLGILKNEYFYFSKPHKISTNQK